MKRDPVQIDFFDLLNKSFRKLIRWLANYEYLKKVFYSLVFFYISKSLFGV